MVHTHVQYIFEMVKSSAHTCVLLRENNIQRQPNSRSVGTVCYKPSICYNVMLLYFQFPIFWCDNTVFMVQFCCCTKNTWLWLEKDHVFDQNTLFCYQKTCVENVQVLTAAECPNGRQNYLVLSVETGGEWPS